MICSVFLHYQQLRTRKKSEAKVPTTPPPGGRLRALGTCKSIWEFPKPRGHPLGASGRGFLTSIKFQCGCVAARARVYVQTVAGRSGWGLSSVSSPSGTGSPFESITCCSASRGRGGSVLVPRAGRVRGRGHCFRCRPAALAQPPCRVPVGGFCSALNTLPLPS